MRADAIGIDVRTHRWLAFTVAGAAAGLAGGLFAFSKGSIDPTLISIPMSIDFLVMMLLGGMQTVIGPLVGAAAFHSISDFVMPLTDYWRLLLGLAIIAIVLVFPRGIVGEPRIELRARLGAGDRRAVRQAEGRGMSLLSVERPAANRSAAWWPPATSRSPSRPASCSPSSARTAPASRPSSTWWAGSSCPTAAACVLDGSDITGLAAAPHLAPRRRAAPSRWRRRSCP